MLFDFIGNLFSGAAHGLAKSSIFPGESGGIPTGGSSSSSWGLGDSLRFFGATAGAVSSYNSYRSQASTARANAQLSLDRSRIEAQRYEATKRRRLGTIRARIGASGTTFSGSNLDVLADRAAEEEYNRMLILYGGQAEASQSKAQAKNLKGRADAALLGGLSSGIADSLPRLLD